MSYKYFSVEKFRSPASVALAPSGYSISLLYYQQRKIKLPFRQSYFSCGDGGNRIPVQKVFTKKSTCVACLFVLN